MYFVIFKFLKFTNIMDIPVPPAPSIIPSPVFNQDDKISTRPPLTEIQKKICKQFLHDLDKIFHIGSETSFNDIYKDHSYNELITLKAYCSIIPFQKIKRTLEKNIKNMGYNHYVSYKKWTCLCRRNNDHIFPMTICIRCGSGIKRYNPNFGIQFTQ